MNKKLLTNFIAEGDYIHIARNVFPADTQTDMHTHDFSEIFWIEKGDCEHWVNNKKIHLEVGQLVIMRPEDNHCYFSKNGFTMVNMAFYQDILNYIKYRYFQDNERFFDQDAKLPDTYSIDHNQIFTLKKSIIRLSNKRKSRLETDSFLLNLLSYLSDQINCNNVSKIPFWLQETINNFNEPEYFKGGVEYFAKITGKSPEYVAREIRKFLNTTTIELINRARMRYAATQLAMTDLDIIEISIDCGFQSLSHFYKVFKAYHGITPQKFRSLKNIMD